MDQDLLAALQFRPVDQCLPGSQRDQRDRGSFFHAERLRLERDIGLVDGYELGEGADPILVGPGVHLIARLEALHPGGGSKHDAGHLIAQDERQSIRQKELELAVSDLRVERVDAGGVDLDQDVVRPQLGFGHLAEAAACLAVAIDDERLHDRPTAGRVSTMAHKAAVSRARTICSA